MRDVVREAVSNYAVDPFRVVRIEENGRGICLFIEELPCDLTAREWLPIYQKSTLSLTKADTYLFLGTCTIVSVALAVIHGCDVLKVRMPQHRAVIKIKMDEGQEQEEERIYHTDHLVVTKMHGRKRLVMDMTGCQFEWPEQILNKWVSIEDYAAATKVTYDEATCLLSPTAYLKDKVDDYSGHRVATRHVIRCLKELLV